MSFVSFPFILFIGAVFLAYYLIPKKQRWIVLLVASYIFYALNDIKALILIVLTTCTVFFTGIVIDRFHTEQKTLIDSKGADITAEERKSHKDYFAKKRKQAVVFALLLNFGILAFLKYSWFFTEIINGILPKFSVSAQIPYLDLLLPLGISFYTFQSLGYIIDVYRGKHPADRNLAKFALFVSFFPQIVQGPISRHDQLAHQLTEPHDFNYGEFKYGVQLILWGFFKKLVIADRAAILTDSVLPNYTQYEGIEIGFGVFLFMIRVYADFSGGMDIARGVSRCLGIDLVRNFNRPYFAISIADYWRRWHMTLGGWMREYLLYSITFSKGYAKLNKWFKVNVGGYLGKIIPSCFVMGIVFFTVGIWHGAGWKYIMFGVYNSGLIIIGLLMTGFLQYMRTNYPELNTTKPLIRTLTTLGTVFLVLIGRFFSASNGMRHAIGMLTATFSVFNPSALFGDFFTRTGFGYSNLAVLAVAGTLLFIVSFMQERGVNIREYFARRNILLRWLAYYFIIMCTLLFGIYGAEESVFVYQRF